MPRGTESRLNELEIVELAARLLRDFGSTTVEYITAEFSPFSAQFRPDLAFRPNAMPGHTFLVEYRVTPPQGVTASPDARAKQLAEHRDFVLTDPKTTLHFAFASSGDRDEELAKLLCANSVAYLAPITSSQALADTVYEWANSIERGAH